MQLTEASDSPPIFPPFPPLAAFAHQFDPPFGVGFFFFFSLFSLPPCFFSFSCSVTTKSWPNIAAGKFFPPFLFRRSWCLFLLRCFISFPLPALEMSIPPCAPGPDRLFPRFSRNPSSPVPFQHGETPDALASFLTHSVSFNTHGTQDPLSFDETLYQGGHRLRSFP